MSYHILHQFDEQWLADLNQSDEDKSRKNLLRASGPEDDSRRRSKVLRDGNRWAIITAAVLMATFALFFAIDATQRAELLQQRLDAVERQVSTMNRKV